MDSIKADVTGAADQGGTGLMKASSPVSRRTVVATGVAAAWAIPVIQLATAAPALAASNGTTTVTWGGLSAVYPNGDGGHLHVTGSVTNSGTVNAASGVIVNLFFPVALGTGAVPNPPPNWAVSRSSDGKTWTLTLVGDLAKSSSAPIDITFTMPDSSGNAFTLNASAQASNAPVVSTSATVAATTTLSWSGFTANFGNGWDSNKFAVSASVKNTGTVAAPQTQVTITFPAAQAGASLVSSPSGWTVTSSPATSPTSFTFTQTADLAAGATDTLPLIFKVPSGAGFSLNASAMASNAASQSAPTVTLGQALAGLTIQSLGSVYTAGKQVRTEKITAVVTNSSAPGAMSATAVKLVVNTKRAPSGVTAATGWSRTAVSTDNLTHTFSYSGSLDPAVGSDVAAVFSFDSNAGNGTYTLNATATGTNAVTGTATNPQAAG